MAHYARVDSNNIVTYVTPIPNEMITDENGVEHEEWALDHLYTTIPDSIGDRWIQTSYNNNFRKKFAGIGYSYDEKFDAFISPKPYPSWIFNDQIVDWEAPIPLPDQDKEYFWNEDLKKWIG